MKRPVMLERGHSRRREDRAGRFARPLTEENHPVIIDSRTSNGYSGFLRRWLSQCSFRYYGDTVVESLPRTRVQTRGTRGSVFMGISCAYVPRRDTIQRILSSLGNVVSVVKRESFHLALVSSSKKRLPRRRDREGTEESNETRARIEEIGRRAEGRSRVTINPLTRHARRTFVSSSLPLRVASAIESTRGVSRDGSRLAR